MNALKSLSVWTLCLTLAFSPLAIAEEYEAHEWGTFTTLSDPDGKLLTGLEVEEDSLPRFVHSLIRKWGPEAREDYPSHHFPPSNNLPGFGLRTKGLGVKVHNVTVKMETPVIYFYSENDQRFPVKVKVGFAGGSIAQWYPARSSGEEVGFDRQSKGIDFAGGKYQGSIGWDIDVLPLSKTAHFEVVKGSDTPAWIHPRLPDSNIVASRSHPHEKEKYLFYRGVGNFELPAKFKQIDDDRVSIETGQPIPFALIYQRHGSGARFKTVNNLSPGELITEFSENEKYQPLREIQIEMLSLFQSELVAGGLTGDEAESMLLTWWESYFLAAGTRVFWIVPRSEVDRILPLSLDPTPKNLERVIVGRAELISPKLEEKLITEFSKADTDDNNFRLNRYFKAYETRYAPASKPDPEEAPIVDNSSESRKQVQIRGIFLPEIP